VDAIICLFIHSVGISKEEARANAALIQKAPDLFRVMDDVNDSLYHAEGDPEDLLRINRRHASCVSETLFGAIIGAAWASAVVVAVVLVAIARLSPNAARGYSYAMRGSRTPYSKSTIRFMTAIIAANIKTVPSITG